MDGCLWCFVSFLPMASHFLPLVRWSFLRGEGSFALSGWSLWHCEPIACCPNVLGHSLLCCTGNVPSLTQPWTGTSSPKSNNGPTSTGTVHQHLPNFSRRTTRGFKGETYPKGMSEGMSLNTCSMPEMGSSEHLGGVPLPSRNDARNILLSQTQLRTARCWPEAGWCLPT